MTGTMRLRPTNRGERIASAKLSGLAAAHQDGRLDQAAALAEMHDVLAEHRIAGGRVLVVMSDAACQFIADPHRPRALAVLVAAGADPELARRMRAETGRGLQFSDPPPR